MPTYGGTPASQTTTQTGSTSSGGNVYNYYTILGGTSGQEVQQGITHSAPGSVAINWATASNWRVTSAGHNVTGLTESNGPPAGFVKTGTLEVKNTGSVSLTVDFTGLTHGLDAIVTIPAGESDNFVVWSTS